jgi:hypothetical protein
MAKKWIILFLALALPVFIFLFLKKFGSNQFDLPYFHETAETWPAGCPPPDTFPFKIKSEFLPGVNDRPALVVFQNPDSEASQRIPVEIDTASLKIIFKPEIESPCVFGVTAAAAAILIDVQGNLRGIFESLDRDETDRLIMESKILLKDY